MSYRNPFPTVDLVIELADRPGHIVFVERGHEPPGFALPGGFVEYGESCEQAARREALEETALEVTLVEQLHLYSDPGRDPRFHTVSLVFIATAKGEPRAGDDAAGVRVCRPEAPPLPLAFDHARIVADYLEYRRTGCRPKP